MSTIEAKSEALQKSKAEEFATACPSRVIEMALEDLEAVERSKKYKVEMDACHDPRHGKCYVCLGGAVIANRFGADPDERMVFDSCDGWGDEETKRLSALDCFRQGYVAWGLDYFDVKWLDDEKHTVARYQRNTKRFKADMRAIAELLKSHGL